MRRIMGMTRGFTVLVAVAAVLALLAAPAAAQSTYVSVRYWPTRFNATWGTGTGSGDQYDANFLSLSLRRNIAGPWALSFNADMASPSNRRSMGTFLSAGTATGGQDNMWNLNLHRRFPFSTGEASVFVGWENAGFRSDLPAFPANPAKGRYTGVRIGADFMTSRGPWSLMAWGAVGVGGTLTTSLINGNTLMLTPVDQSGQGGYNEFGALVGYRFLANWGIDAGYRQVTISTAGFTGTAFTVSSATYRWSGFTVGVSGSW